jgi:hypothetical protein
MLDVNDVRSVLFFYYFSLYDFNIIGGLPETLQIN